MLRLLGVTIPLLLTACGDATDRAAEAAPQVSQSLDAPSPLVCTAPVVTGFPLAAASSISCVRVPAPAEMF